MSARDLRAQHRGQAEKMAGAAAVAAAANGGACCHAAKGPGYATPLEAMEKGPREKLVYVTCVYNGACFLCLYHATCVDRSIGLQEDPARTHGTHA